LANSAAGAALEEDVQQEKDTTAKTFVPGEGRSAEESFVTNFTPEQKEVIRQMVASAASPAEIEAIESSVRRGVLPTAALPAATNATTATTNGDGRKRPASENGADDSNGDEGETAAKKSRVEENSPPEEEQEEEDDSE
jgi:hypothetical protein